jgi:hypothetical protein
MRVKYLGAGRGKGSKKACHAEAIVFNELNYSNRLVTSRASILLVHVDICLSARKTVHC